MNLLLLQQILNYLNLGLEGISVVFITFVFFDLIFVDKNIQLSQISEKFEKFKRYDIFKNSLIFLVLSLYFGFFAKLSYFFEFPELAFSIFSMIANIFLIAFVYSLYQLMHKYVPDAEK
jgi:hypothetical protein